MSPIALRIARTELRRTLRTVASSRTKILLYGVLGVVFFAPFLLFGSLLLSTAGEELAAGEIGSDALASVPAFVTGGAAVAFVGLTVFATIRTVTAVGDVDQPAFLLLSTPLRNAVLGLLLREAAYFATWLATPALVLASAFAWGAGEPLVVPAALATLVVVIGTAVPVGFAVGIPIRHLLTVYEPIARYRTPIFVGLGLLYFGGIALGWLDSVVGVLFEALGGSPLGWPGQLLLAGVPRIGFTAPEAAGAVVGATAVLAFALTAGVRMAEYHWFSDPARTSDGAEESGAGETDSSDRLGATLGGLVSRPVATVAVTALRRTKRAPIRLVYVAYPLFGMFVFVESLVQTGTIPAYGAVMLSLYVVWAAGAAFTLNVLGDHGPAIESVLTSTVSGREVIGGTVVAGVLVGLPLAVLVPVATGLASPLGVTETALLVAGTVVGVCVSPGLAAGVGTWFPRFGSVRVTNNREAVIPSKTAFLLYSLAVLVPSAAAALLYTDAGPGAMAELLSFLLSLPPALDVTVPTTGIVAVAWAAVIAGLVAPVASVRYAVARFDSYRPY
jgi:hypothetical protein